MQKRCENVQTLRKCKKTSENSGKTLGKLKKIKENLRKPLKKERARQIAEN